MKKKPKKLPTYEEVLECLDEIYERLEEIEDRCDMEYREPICVERVGHA